MRCRTESTSVDHLEAEARLVAALLAGCRVRVQVQDGAAELQDRAVPAHAHLEAARLILPLRLADQIPAAFQLLRRWHQAS